MGTPHLHAANFIYVTIVPISGRITHFNSWRNDQKAAAFGRDVHGKWLRLLRHYLTIDSKTQAVLKQNCNKSSTVSISDRTQIPLLQTETAWPIYDSTIWVYRCWRHHDPAPRVILLYCEYLICLLVSAQFAFIVFHCRPRY